LKGERTGKEEKFNSSVENSSMYERKRTIRPKRSGNETEERLEGKEKKKVPSATVSWLKVVTHTYCLVVSSGKRREALPVLCRLLGMERMTEEEKRKNHLTLCELGKKKFAHLLVVNGGKKRVKDERVLSVS